MGLCIVIVEDDALVAMDLAELLIGMGHNVCSIAGTEAEAAVAAERCQPELMIVDGTLGTGSGVTAMRRILDQRYVSHFYVTGNPWGLRDLEPDGIIVAKPFTLRDLNQGIKAAREAGRRRLNSAI